MKQANTLVSMCVCRVVEEHHSGSSNQVRQVSFFCYKQFALTLPMQIQLIVFFFYSEDHGQVSLLING